MTSEMVNQGKFVWCVTSCQKCWLDDQGANLLMMLLGVLPDSRSDECHQGKMGVAASLCRGIPQ